MLLGLFCLPWIVKYWWKEATGHAIHFCTFCGIHLAYWNGNTYVFAKDKHLNTSFPRGPDNKELSSEAPSIHMFAKSPLGSPPMQGSELYALKWPQPSRKSYKLEVELDQRTNFLRRITDPVTRQILLTMAEPRLEEHEWHYAGRRVFLPFEKNREEAEKKHLFKPFSREEVNTTLHFRWGPSQVSYGRPQTLVDLRFERYTWDISLYWPDVMPWRGKQDFGLGDSRCITQRLYLPFLSSAGPLVWTTRKMGTIIGQIGRGRGQRDESLVLLDAYDRVVAYGDLAVYDRGMPLELLAEILATYAALRVQLLRLEQWKEAYKNQQDHEAAEKAALG